MMNKTLNKQLLALICLIISVATITSCVKDKVLNTTDVQLLSFGPTGARIGDTLRFIGTNLNLVTEITFTGKSAVVPQSAFKQQTAELILVVVPAAAEKGFVTLKAPQGNIVTKTQLDLQVISSITSMTAQARPMEAITIKGEYLNWVTQITFGKGKAVDSFVSKTSNQIVVMVPVDAQTGPLLFTYSGTKPMQVETKDTFIVTLPMVTAMAPNPVKHQTDLTITGTNLDLVKQILFTGVGAPITTFTSQTATQIVVNVPASTKKGKISLVAASGVSTQSATDLDVVLPAITSMAPNPIDALANLTIVGQNLDLVTSISFTGVLNPVSVFVSKTATQLVVKVPTGTLKGKLTLNVLNSTLTVQSAVDLVLNGGLPPLTDFPYAIYTDAFQNGWQDYSYTDTHDFNSTNNVRQGTKSAKIIYGGNSYQAITFHSNTPVSTTGYTKLEFSIFGEAGTAGKKLNIVFDGKYSAVAGQVTIIGGEWTTYSLSFSNLGNPATISEITLQSAGFTGTVNFDHVGFR